MFVLLLLRVVRGGAFGQVILFPSLMKPWLLNGGRIDDNILGAHYVRNFSVNSMIDTSCKSWNNDLVQVFSADIAYTILRTPLLEQVPNDKFIWKAEKNGLYYVKSAYMLCVEDLVDTSHIRRPGYWSNISHKW